MKFLIPGGSGQIGTLLARTLVAAGHQVTVLSRIPKPTDRWKTLPWDGVTRGAWEHELEGTDIVINLAGRSVNCRATAQHQAEILASRVDSTRVIAAAIAHASTPPKLWLQMSTATIYAHTHGAAHDEKHGAIGGGERDAPPAWRFSVDVARAWEAATRSAGPLPRTRVVLLRSAMTMSPDRGGIFDTLLRLVRFGLGGTAGDGRQFVSWIHEADFVRAIRWLIEHEDISGPVNLASPEPLPNREFMVALRHVWGAHIGLPAAPWLVELGAILLRTESELVLKSRRVIPGRLLDGGFGFVHPSWPAAAADLCRRWRAGPSGFPDGQFTSPIPR